VRKQVEARDVAELEHGMREGAHVDAGNRIEKLLAVLRYTPSRHVCATGNRYE
jgi:hypothetical protein